MRDRRRDAPPAAAPVISISRDTTHLSGELRRGAASVFFFCIGRATDAEERPKVRRKVDDGDDGDDDACASV